MRGSKVLYDVAEPFERGSLDDDRVGKGADIGSLAL